MLEVILVAILMVVVAIAGKKQDSTYHTWAKILFFLLIAWMLWGLYEVGQAWLELEQLIDEFKRY